MIDEYGPIYGVKLIATLPLGNGWRQAMPNRQDLQYTRQRNDRVAAGYEVMLSKVHEIIAICNRHAQPGVNGQTHEVCYEILRILGERETSK